MNDADKERIDALEQRVNDLYKRTEDLLELQEVASSAALSHASDIERLKASMKLNPNQGYLFTDQ